MEEDKKELLLFQLGPVQEFIAQAAEIHDLWAGSYLLSSLMLTGARAVPGWNEEKTVNTNFVFPNFSDDSVIKAMEGTEKIPSIPNRFLVWVDSETGRTTGDKVKAVIRARLKELAKDLPSGASEQVDQFLQMSYAVYATDPSKNQMGADYQEVGRRLAARRAVREFSPWKEAEKLGSNPKDFLSGKEAALKDGLGAMNLLKRRLYDQALTEGKEISSVVTREDPYIAIIAMDGDRMGRNLSKFETADQHRAFSGELAKFASCVDEIVEKAYHGRLIYAGGDDVLAVVNAKEAIQCAQALRQAFGSVKGWNGEPLTASAGIAVGHEAVPLQELIHRAHSEESRAKNAYGRNALALGVFKRSGEILEWGCNWDSNAFKVFDALRESRAGLPTRFPYKLAELLQPYGKIDQTMAEVVKYEFEHAWSRSTGKDVPMNIKGAADAYLDEACAKGRLNDFLVLFLCDTFIERNRKNDVGKEEK